MHNEILVNSVIAIEGD